MRIIGIDPGLQHTGWGVIDINGNNLKYVADGVVNTSANMDTAERLKKIAEVIIEQVNLYKPHESAIEQVFVNSNPASSLKLGLARGAAMLALAQAGLSVAEYTPNEVKKAVVGAGHAEKHQIQAMIKILLGGVEAKSADSADALAVAICHAHNASTSKKVNISLK